MVRRSCRFSLRDETLLVEFPSRFSARLGAIAFSLRNRIGVYRGLAKPLAVEFRVDAALGQPTGRSNRAKPSGSKLRASAPRIGLRSSCKSTDRRRRPQERYSQRIWRKRPNGRQAARCLGQSRRSNGSDHSPSLPAIHMQSQRQPADGFPHLTVLSSGNRTVWPMPRHKWSLSNRAACRRCWSMARPAWAKRICSKASGARHEKLGPTSKRFIFRPSSSRPITSKPSAAAAACRISRRKYRGVELLIIDGLQFFAGKQVTMNELLYTTDTLLREGRQSVFAADRPANDLRNLSGELVTRLSSGLACSIDPPDYPTRLGILRRLARSAGWIYRTTWPISSPRI